MGPGRISKHTLDDVIKVLIRSNKQLSIIDLQKEFSKYMPSKEITKDIQDYIINGYTIIPHPDSMGQCYKIKMVKTANKNSVIYVPQFIPNHNKLKYSLEKCSSWF